MHTEIYISTAAQGLKIWNGVGQLWEWLGLNQPRVCDVPWLNMCLGDLESGEPSCTKFRVQNVSTLRAWRLAAHVAVKQQMTVR